MPTPRPRSFRGNLIAHPAYAQHDQPARSPRRRSVLIGPYAGSQPHHPQRAHVAACGQSHLPGPAPPLALLRSSGWGAGMVSVAGCYGAGMEHLRSRIALAPTDGLSPSRWTAAGVLPPPPARARPAPAAVVSDRAAGWSGGRPAPG